EHPHVAQNRLADEFLDAGGLFRGLVTVRQHHVDVIVGQDEAASAGIGCHVQRYRTHPAGRIAAMKPPLALTTLLSRIGSPAATGLRTMAPTKSLMASGRSDFLMKLELAASAGQVCQPTSCSPTT